VLLALFIQTAFVQKALTWLILWEVLPPPCALFCAKLPQNASLQPILAWFMLWPPGGTANAADARLDPIINAAIPAATVAMRIILIFVCI
jgi:hypothetical protein